MPEAANPKLRVASTVLSVPPAMNGPAYAELCVTSNFSFLRGASHPDELVVRAAELGYRAIGITDRNSFAGAVRMHAAAKEVGIKLVVGVRLTFAQHPDLLVWPQNRGAYGRLCKLLTAGKRRTTKGNCELGVYEFLEESAGVHAAFVPPEVLTEECSRNLRTLKDALGARLSLAASCTYESDNCVRLGELLALSRSYGVPLLATNDAHYHVPERRALQDVLSCIRLGCSIHDAGLNLFQNGERYLKPPSPMHALFAQHPEAIRRGIEIADECSFNLQELRYEYPRELSPAGKSPLEYLAELAWSGANERYPDGIPEKVHALLERELRLIGELSIEPYFLTVYDIVRFARSRGILCQGRGSAANSAVCYCLGVTSVDPSKIDVLFERFVSSARNEPPDIDIDFEHERREEVIQYVYEKYGRDRAGMTAEVITYRGRSAVRDVGKALGLGTDTVDHMAKRLDWWDKGTLTPDSIRSLGLDPADRTVRLVIQLTGELLGFPRHLSQHVGGMVMTSGLLCEMVPIENASMPDRTVIEWDKQDIDDLGILKVDILGLGMLTCIAKSIQFINDARATGETPLQMHTIPAEDPAVYDMVSDADTVGVFQIESRAQMSMLPRLRPKEFYDLVIEVAIVRPGPIQGDMVHPYLRRRQGLEKVEYPQEGLRTVLGKTLGVPLFQEQAMRIAIECAGFSPEEADRLRRAVTGFRRYGDIETFAQKFVGGMLDRGYEKEFAERCFAQLRGFSSYGFPESHAASFALLVYVSSWIKRHHPAAFCAGLLNSQPMGFYAPAQIVRDAQLHGVAVLPVDVNFSEWDCTLAPPAEVSGADVTPKWNWGKGGPSVRLGLRMVRGLRALHAERIVSARRTCGVFRSFSHFARTTGLPSDTMLRLAEADAFGSFGVSRREALWEVMSYQDEPMPLFEALDEDRSGEVHLPVMPAAEEVATDYRTAGLSLKRHPVALVRDQLARMRIIPAATLAHMTAGRWV
ncbi:MAG: error-prone polymerase, partial [Phycisphaerales bacterium]|nr:error-prone polymerase [Phycisphaerales bacterium]